MYQIKAIGNLTSWRASTIATVLDLTIVKARMLRSGMTIQVEKEITTAHAIGTLIECKKKTRTKHKTGSEA